MVSFISTTDFPLLINFVIYISTVINICEVVLSGQVSKADYWCIARTSWVYTIILYFSKRVMLFSRIYIYIYHYSPVQCLNILLVQNRWNEETFWLLILKHLPQCKSWKREIIKELHFRARIKSARWLTPMKNRIIPAGRFVLLFCRLGAVGETIAFIFAAPDESFSQPSTN